MLSKVIEFVILIVVVEMQIDSDLPFQTKMGLIAPFSKMLSEMLPKILKRVQAKMSKV